MKKIKLEEFTQRAFEEANIDKAILAFGSTECHGYHLPYGCDTFVAYDIAKEVANRLDNTLVVPPMWYGMSMHYRHKPMCITLSNDTLAQVYREVMESLIYWNIKKILVINGKIVSELDMVYIETLLHESRTLFLTVRSMRTQPPPSEFITQHTDSYISNMVCPPPPSQPRISEKSLGNLIVPAPSQKGG